MVNIIDVNFNNQEHCKAVIDLMNHYMQDDMGGNTAPHTPESGLKLIEGLKNHCNKLCLLAIIEGNFVGLTNCFIGFGTFAAKPFINIHDVVVLNEYRGQGIGKALLNEVISRAQAMQCGKVTLEVRTDNTKAKTLYRNLDFARDNPPYEFWAKYSV